MREKNKQYNNSNVNRPRTGDYIILAVLIILAIIILYPFYNTVLISFVKQKSYMEKPLMVIPRLQDLTLNSYKVVLGNKALLNGLWVTTRTTIIGVVYNMFLTVCAAYVLSKRVKGHKIFMAMVIIPMYFNGGLIPNYLLIKNIGLYDTLFSMVLPTGVVMVYLIVIKNFFQQLPPELEEAARLDGANEFQVLFRIIVPLSLPILVTYTLYYAVHRWNEWYLGMLYIKDLDKRPLQLVLREIISMTAEFTEADAANVENVIFSEGIKMASVVLTMIPIVMIYPYLQRYFVKGTTAGSGK